MVHFLPSPAREVSHAPALFAADFFDWRASNDRDQPVQSLRGPRNSADPRVL